MSGDEGGRAGPVRVLAPAKINLWLEVLGRRPDGYHEIRTIMQTVSLCDELIFTPRKDGQVVLEAAGEGLPQPEENLVARAARLMQRRLGCRRGVEVRLRKRIPVGGGFGGGSSDCAATLRTLNALWGAGLSRQQLVELGAELGSDVPFFLCGGTALCEGRGERVTPLPVHHTFHYVLLVPPHGTSTREVYRSLALTGHRGRCTMQCLRLALRSGDTNGLGAALHNALEAAVARLYPDIGRIAQTLRSGLAIEGYRGFSLTGSGCGFFVLFDGVNQAREAAAELARRLSVAALAVQSVPAETCKDSRSTEGDEGI